MRVHYAGFLAIVAAGVLACSGESVRQDDPNGGTGGTAAAGSGGTAGQGGSGGVAGQAGAGGMAGQAGAGGMAGQAGSGGVAGQAGAGGMAGQGGAGGVAGQAGAGGVAGQAGSGGAPQVSPVVPADGVATDIDLEVYSDGWGKLLKKLHMDKEGSMVISVDEQNPYSNPPKYYIYAKSKGFYTELYNCKKGESIDVDLDAVPQVPQALTGVVFAQQSFFADCYHSGASMTLTGPGGASYPIKTDNQGRYGLQGLPSGDYKLSFTVQGQPFSFPLNNTAATDYKDIGFMEPMQAAAPNLYLYPTKATQVKVSLSFPQGGSVIKSEPPYLTGWDVHVTPDGTIDDTFGYLFYEASLPQTVDLSAGWMLDGAHLSTELRGLLTTLGFQGREVQDFLDFWLPVLGQSPWFAVYPQDPEKLVTLHISPKPDSLLRSLLLIRAVPKPLTMPAPVTKPFVRDGFVATEWGVLTGL